MSVLHCGYGHSPSVGAAVTNPKLSSHPWLRRSLTVLQLLAHISRQITTRQTTPSILCNRCLPGLPQQCASTPTHAVQHTSRPSSNRQEDDGAWHSFRQRHGPPGSGRGCLLLDPLGGRPPPSPYPRLLWSFFPGRTFAFELGSLGIGSVHESLCGSLQRRFALRFVLTCFGVPQQFRCARAYEPLDISPFSVLQRIQRFGLYLLLTRHSYDSFDILKHLYW